MRASIDLNSWPKPPVFNWLQSQGSIKMREMIRTFNCGIGMVIITSEEEKSAIVHGVKSTGQVALQIGTIDNIKGTEPVIFLGNWG